MNYRTPHLTPLVPARLTTVFFLLMSLLSTGTAQVLTESNLPIIVINTFGVTIPDEPKIPGTMKIIDNGPGQMNHPSDPGNVYEGNIGIEVRGHFSAIFPQKPYSVETRDELQNELNVPLFGFPEEHDWVLLANYNDKVFMRNTLAFKLFNEMGDYASRTRFCEVIVNNAYNGIYIFGEKIKRDNGRVDIAKLLENENTGEPRTGGYILKFDYWDQSNSWQSSYHPIDHPEMNVHFVYEYPAAEKITPAQKQYIREYMNAFEGALYSNNFLDPVFGYSSFIDKGSFIDYFLVNELSRNNDGFKKSYYFYKNRDSLDRRIHSGPVWDFDWAWKNIDECQIFKNTDGSGWAYKVNDCYPDVSSPGWMIRLLQDPGFTAQLKCRYLEMRNSLFDRDSLMQYIDDNASCLNAAQQRHYQRWPILGLNVGAPVVGPIPTTFAGEIADFKHWIDLRLNWLDQNMPGTCDPAGFEARSEQKGILFPNPARDHAYLELLTLTGFKNLECITASGKHVKLPFSILDDVIYLDVRNLSDGYYMLRPIYDSGQCSATFRLSVVH